MLERRYCIGIGALLGSLLVLLCPSRARSQNLPGNNGVPPGHPVAPNTQPASPLPSSTYTAQPVSPNQVTPYSATPAQPYPTSGQVPPGQVQVPPGQVPPQTHAVYAAGTPAYPPSTPASSTLVTAPENTNGAAKPIAKPTDWSIGAGLLYQDGGLAVLGGQPSTAGLAYSPGIRTSVFLERRLWDHVYLLFQPDFSYRKYYRDNNAISSGLFDRSTSVGASLGLRWVANPGDVVEIGMTHLFDTDWTYQKGSTLISQVDGNVPYVQSNVQQVIYDVGLSTGLVAEYMLMRQLWLRIHVALVRVSYAKVTNRHQDQNGPSGIDHNSVFDLSLLSTPRLEVRLTW